MDIHVWNDLLSFRVRVKETRALLCNSVECVQSIKGHLHNGREALNLRMKSDFKRQSIKAEGAGGGPIIY